MKQTRTEICTASNMRKAEEVIYECQREGWEIVNVWVLPKTLCRYETVVLKFEKLAPP